MYCILYLNKTKDKLSLLNLNGNGKEVILYSFDDACACCQGGLSFTNHSSQNVVLIFLSLKHSTFIIITWHPVHILHTDQIFTTLPGTQWSDHPSLTFDKGMKAVPIHCHFPMQHRCWTLGRAKVKINPRQISAVATMWDHTWLLVCRSLLRGVYGLAGSLNSKGQRTTLTCEIMRRKWIKVSKIKGTTHCNTKRVEHLCHHLK